MSEEISTKETGMPPETGELTTLLKQEFPDDVTDFHAHRDDETVVIETRCLGGCLPLFTG